jgi:hypothetical protein
VDFSFGAYFFKIYLEVFIYIGFRVVGKSSHAIVRKRENNVHCNLCLLPL